jgi:hypothetical protein
MERDYRVSAYYLESVVTFSNKSGKFGDLVFGHRDATRVDVKDRKETATVDLSHSVDDRAKPGNSDPADRGISGSFPVGGPFSGKIGFRKGL